MTEANNIIKDFKAPPTLGKNSVYLNWKKEALGGIFACPRRKTCPCYFHDIDRKS